MALSPDGTMLAVAAVVARSGTDVVDVFSRDSRGAQIWRWPGRGTIPSLSWGGDRSLLALWLDSHWPARTTADRSGLYLIRTPAAAARPAPRLLVSYFTRFGPFSQLSPDAEYGVTITPDGSVGYAAMSTSQSLGRREAIVAFSARTGAAARIITPVTAIDGLGGSYCSVLWSDRSGQHLIAVCGRLAGTVSNGRFTALRHPAYVPEAGFPFAW
jgi:hypothetical protein